MRNLSLVELRRRTENPTDLYRVLWQLIEQIPIGSVSTYGELAQTLGDRVATRWVGKVLLTMSTLISAIATGLCGSQADGVSLSRENQSKKRSSFPAKVS
ncbi:MAG: MGMT family protein [Pirellulaceae bacterium]|nr:MGMT family protein [Pirellulaceae bacterium]